MLGVTFQKDGHSRSLGNCCSRRIHGARFWTPEETTMLISVLDSPPPVFDPPAPLAVRDLLNDANNDTCISLSQTDMYTFSPSDRCWTPQPRVACWLSGLVIKKRVPDAIKKAFSVVITGRRLVCSNLRLMVRFEP